MFSLALSMTPPPFASLAYQFLHAGLILSALFVYILLGGPLLRALMDMFQQGTVSIAALFFLSLCGAFAGSLVSTFTGQGGSIMSLLRSFWAFTHLGVFWERVRSLNALGESALKSTICAGSQGR